MAIKTKITGSAEYGQYMRVLLAGDPGAGKTLMSSTFPNPYFVSAEGGTMSIARRFLPYVELETTDQLKEIHKALRQDPVTRGQMLGAPERVDTLVIDTIDEVAKLFIKERLKAKDIETFQDYKDWGWLSDKVESFIRSFRNLPLNVVFTVHLKVDKDEESGANSYLPNLSGQQARYLPGAVDLAFVLQTRVTASIEDGKSVRKIVRYAQTYSDARYPWAKDRSGRLPQEFEVNFEDDYQRMNDLIFGGMKEDFEQAKVRAAQKVTARAESIKEKFTQPDRPDPLKTDRPEAEAEFQAFAEQATNKQPAKS